MEGTTHHPGLSGYLFPLLPGEHKSQCLQRRSIIASWQGHPRIQPITNLVTFTASCIRLNPPPPVLDIITQTARAHSFAPADLTMGSHNLAASLLALLPLLSGKVAAQQAQCATLADGCSAGTAHDAALRSALARFEPDSFYGVGSDPVVFSSFLQGNTLAQIAYSCRDGSRPPPLTGSAIRTL